MTRQIKTPAQRAQEALAAETRKMLRLDKKVQETQRQLNALDAEFKATCRRVEYLAANPDLPPRGPAGKPTTTEGDTPA